MQCMSHAIVTKDYLKADYPNVENDWDTYGLPEVIVDDNGKEFYSNSFFAVRLNEKWQILRLIFLFISIF